MDPCIALRISKCSLGVNQPFPQFQNKRVKNFIRGSFTQVLGGQVLTLENLQSHQSSACVYSVVVREGRVKGVNHRNGFNFGGRF